MRLCLGLIAALVFAAVVPGTVAESASRWNEPEGVRCAYGTVEVDASVRFGPAAVWPGGVDLEIAAADGAGVRKEEPRRCCKWCEVGKPCGDTCISDNKQCSKPPGCACERKER